MAGKSILTLRRRMGNIFRPRNETKAAKHHKNQQDLFEDTAFADAPINFLDSLGASIPESFLLHQPHENIPEDLANKDSVTTNSLTYDKEVTQSIKERTYRPSVPNQVVELDDIWLAWLRDQCLEYATRTNS